MYTKRMLPTNSTGNVNRGYRTKKPGTEQVTEFTYNITPDVGVDGRPIFNNTLQAKPSPSAIVRARTFVPGMFEGNKKASLTQS